MSTFFGIFSQSFNAFSYVIYMAMSSLLLWKDILVDYDMADIYLFAFDYKWILIINSSE